MANSQSVSAETFVATFLMIHKKGLTFQELLAEFPKSKPSTLYVKRTNLNKQLRARHLPTLPKLKSAPKGRKPIDFDRIAKMIRDHNNSLQKS